MFRNVSCVINKLACLLLLILIHRAGVLLYWSVLLPVCFVIFEKCVFYNFREEVLFVSGQHPFLHDPLSVLLALHHPVTLYRYIHLLLV